MVLVLFSRAMMTLACLTWLLFSISFVYGQDDTDTMPPPVNTTFSCRGRDTGFYADVENDCAVYHTCDNHGNKFTYYCPKETKFRQETLVCDHAHLVNCKSAEKLITKVSQDIINSSDNLDSFRSSSVLSRSFTISQVPSRLLEPPKENSKKSTTFTMSSTVFLRNSNVKKNENAEKSISSTTARPFHLNHKFKDLSEFPASEMSKNRAFDGLRKNKNIEDQGKSTTRPFFLQRDNYPYRETLRSIQNRAEGIHHSTRITTTTQRTTTAGTEFPIPAFRSDLFGYTTNDEDPYYPKLPTSTEIYYTLKNEKSHRPLYFSSTPRPFASSLNIKIPDVLPDFNTVDDLVDRRKILYIPRAKSL